MDIERINENTFKVYISYIDIEERGFSRDEIWFNKDKSEQLFWEMMDEVNDEDDFEDLEGPLWIQVHAMEKGLEVIVTKTHVTKNNSSSDSLYDMQERSKQNFKNGASSSIETHEYDDLAGFFEDFEEIPSEYVYEFANFDDILPLAKKMVNYSILSSLHHYNDKYYLYIRYINEANELVNILNISSIIAEYASKSPITIHVIQEYGKEIISKNVFNELNNFF